MAINAEKFMEPAVRGNVSGVAINCSVALTNIANCFDAINNHRPLDPQAIAAIREVSTELQRAFEELTGWTAD